MVPTLARLIGSMGFAMAITLALFRVMTELIVVEGVDVRIVEPIPSISIVRIIRDERNVPIVRTPMPEKNVYESQPKLPSLDPSATSSRKAIEIRTAIPSTGNRRGHGIVDGISAADGDATALIRVAPGYPERALARGIEGRVLVEFDVTETGAVVNARVVASEPSDVFDAAALSAVRQWRYDPKIVNGRAVRQSGLRIAIPFVRDERSSGTPIGSRLR